MDKEKTMEEQKKELIEIVSKIEDVNVLKEIYEELCKCMEEELEEQSYHSNGIRFALRYHWSHIRSSFFLIIIYLYFVITCGKDSCS